METENRSGGENLASAESLVEDIKNSFVPTDDFPRDFAVENKLIMNERASLLILSALNGGRLAPFMKAGDFTNGRRLFTLRKPAMHIEKHGSETYVFPFDTLELRCGHQP